MASMKRTLAGSIAAAALLLSTGCIGTHSNMSQFLNDPAPGAEELNVLQQYGTPAFAAEVDNHNVYTYKVRENNYFIFIGFYDGYDLVVTCRDGRVVDARRVRGPESFALFQPWQWVSNN
ncbi:MAG: hypothetical protein SF028_03305 [Candidatus Sumerlaeia bacterium]|nr:hypothetical protein [Candidatus Sumerlaeia bacterium]